MAIMKVRDKDGNIIDIPALVGPKGDPGADYVLTEADKAEIAAQAAELVEVPGGGNGADGFSPIAAVEQTASGAVITITDKDGMTTATVTNGKDGKTPVRGTDYWTEADQNALIQQVIDSLGGTPVFGTVDVNNVITLTGALAEGIYNLRYEDMDGNVTEIGTLNHTNVPEPTYTNLFNPATASINTRMSGSSSASKTQDGYVMTANIALPAPVTVGSSYDENTPYIAVPSAMWSGSASVFGVAEDNSKSYVDFNGTPGTTVGAWKKIPLYNQWGNSLAITNIIVSLYVKESAISATDIQNIEIYFNECPE